jgi:hemolysin-activating ACP:hemolysin acyltransferase
MNLSVGPVFCCNCSAKGLYQSTIMLLAHLSLLHLPAGPQDWCVLLVSLLMNSRTLVITKMRQRGPDNLKMIRARHKQTFGHNQDASERTWQSDNESETQAKLRSARNRKWAEWHSEKKLWKLDDWFLTFGDNQDASERTWRSDNERKTQANLRKDNDNMRRKERWDKMKNWKQTWGAWGTGSELSDTQKRNCGNWMRKELQQHKVVSYIHPIAQV